jgi:para-nitrobenzyl esterase
MPLRTVLLLALLAALPAGTASAQGLVQTTEGPVQGTADEATGVWQFKGIPYAAPPVGDLRFARPQAPDPHASTLLADTYPHACPQFVSQIQAACGEGVGIGLPAGNEDCLYLNVFSPVASWPPAPTLPVMIFIHGGSFVTGCTAEGVTNGPRLSRNGNAIVVTIQYRLGLLGFLGSDELSAEDPDGSSGNWALFDMIEAIRWVKNNAAAFGGDPGNITVFGESAGAVGVCALLASPLTDGLFQRAIMESGNCQTATPLRTTPGSPIDGTTGVQQGASVAEHLGCTTPGAARLECLRGASRDAILAEQATLGSIIEGAGFSPAIDGHVLEERPLIVLQQKGAQGRDVIVGSNGDEMSIFTLDQALIDAVVADYDQAVRDALGDDFADVLLPLYPGATGPLNLLIYRQLLGELFFNCPTVDVARAVSGMGDDAFLYHFTQRPFTAVPFIQLLGSFHALELFYVFGNLELLGNFLIFPDASDMLLSAQMQTAWSTFAATGAPDTSPAWPGFDPLDPRHFVWNATVLDKVQGNFLNGRCESLTAAVLSVDQDRDLVVDAEDNCPDIPNSTQFDVDGNGAGDACETDQDGDGVGNALDRCPGTAPAVAVDAEGCSAVQLLAVCEQGRRSHGRYVNCVANVSREAYRAGLITKKERDAFVKDAARSDKFK